MNTTKLNFWLDAIIGVAFALVLLSGLAAPAGRGASEFHIFAGLSLSIGIALHLVLHRKWLAATARSSEKSGQMKLSLWLNRLLGLSWLWVLLSALGSHHRAGNDSLHAAAAIGMSFILFVHLARHWKWIVTTAKRYWG